MKKIIASALVSILLIGSLASCSESIITLNDGSKCYVAEIDGFNKSDAKYLIEHPRVPLPDTIEISEDMTVEVVNGVPQVSGTIKNVSNHDLKEISISFPTFTAEEIENQENGIYVGNNLVWTGPISNSLKAGKKVAFQTTIDASLSSAAYITLGEVLVSE